MNGSGDMDDDSDCFEETMMAVTIPGTTLSGPAGDSGALPDISSLKPPSAGCDGTTMGCADQQENDEDATTNSSEAALLTCSFNQDGGCLAIGTTCGFSVMNVHPFCVSVNRNRLGGGISQIEMLFRCNLMALVGGGPTPKAPPHRVLIWDDHLPKEIGELSFRQVVLRVRLRKDAIAVALLDRIYVYHLADLSLRDKIYTAENPHGLLVLSTHIQDMVLACPSVTPGHVRVELYGLRKTVLMEAHDGALRSLALTADGSQLATASVKGTVIRVWDVLTANCLHEFRRGVERATVTCLAWSWNAQFLACCSDKGTTHIFKVKEGEQSDDDHHHHHIGKSSTQHHTPQPQSTSFTSYLFSSVMKKMEGDTKKSVVQIRGVPHPQACAFVADAPRLIAIAGWDADGNGVLLISEFLSSSSTTSCGQSTSENNEPRRIGYHVLTKSPTARAQEAESEEERRRRRLRGWTPEKAAAAAAAAAPGTLQTPEGGRLYVGERLEILDGGMNGGQQFEFEELNDDDEFISITAVKTTNTAAAVPQTSSSTAVTEQEEQLDVIDVSLLSPGGATIPVVGDDAAAAEVRSSSQLGSTVGADSVRTEPLEDDCDAC